jgi:hypothetical protein
VDLIVGWHRKAAEEDDYFSRFVFEYLAFIAHLRANVFYEEASDRNVIQALKRDDMRRGRYVERVKTDKHLLVALRRLLVELNRRPLHNSSHDPDYPEIEKWWNCSGPQPTRAEPRGVIRSVDDWENLVEFWYSVRNNLFHGGKNPSVKRDCFLVEHAYETLKAFMDAEIPMATPGQKAAATPKRRQAASQGARTREPRVAGREAVITRKRGAAARKAVATRVVKR